MTFQCWWNFLHRLLNSSPWLMKHNNKRNMCVRLFFLGIFLDNIKIPPSNETSFGRVTKYALQHALQARRPRGRSTGHFYPVVWCGNIQGLKIISCFVTVSSSRKVTGKQLSERRRRLKFRLLRSSDFWAGSLSKPRRQGIQLAKRTTVFHEYNKGCNSWYIFFAIPRKTTLPELKWP